MDGGTRVGDTSVHQALREALANCLVNADYYGRQGLVIIKKRNAITMSNPGSFRIEIDAAKSGGISDPRNGTMLKMFNLIDIGERAGSGIPNIFRVWREQRWTEPIIEETSEPDRTVLSLSLLKKESSDKQVAIKSGDKGAKTAAQKIAILEYLTDHASAKCSDISNMLGVKDARARRILGEMIVEETIVTEGGNRNRIYKLKA
ncbi:ATP-binding protein [Clostridium sp. J1101437_171009_A5]|uniref:ATP-binding protein n=1 Tax=Clostridium sp. J1101437_171009_A5 TaxID=2787098 RepID=UPI00189C0608|nr:ATP-binding protein [Clostridium sp. J1101437_171009_A5]